MTLISEQPNLYSSSKKSARRETYFSNLSTTEASQYHEFHCLVNSPTCRYLSNPTNLKKESSIDSTFHQNSNYSQNLCWKSLNWGQRSQFQGRGGQFRAESSKSWSVQKEALVCGPDCWDIHVIHREYSDTRTY